MNLEKAGEEIYKLIEQLFPISRSLSGNGVRETLRRIQEIIPLQIHEVPTGTKAFDWTVPKEWNITDAYVMDEKGSKVIDFKKHNLHVVGYSVPVDMTVSLAELQNHLYSLEAQPDAIPYITSYYQERWGFCITDRERRALKDGSYRVVIDSELTDGSLTYGELVLPGKSKKEIFISTYTCHPSMANDNLSGPAVATYLAQWVMSAPRKYTYRFVFIPETIGALTYLSKHLGHLKEQVIAGFNLTCMGDERAYSFMPSRNETSLADTVALEVLADLHPDFVRYSFLKRGSDERQYCSPGVDLPVVSIMRSKYGTYPEYHTSLDDLTLVTPVGLGGSVTVLKTCIERLESSRIYRAVCYGEPQLGKRGLYPMLSHENTLGLSEEENAKGLSLRRLLDILAYADGIRDVPGIARTLGISPYELQPSLDTLHAAGLLEEY